MVPNSLEGAYFGGEDTVGAGYSGGEGGEVYYVYYTGGGYVDVGGVGHEIGAERDAIAIAVHFLGHPVEGINSAVCEQSTGVDFPYVASGRVDNVDRVTNREEVLRVVVGMRRSFHKNFSVLRFI